MKLTIDVCAERRGKFAQLEEMTGIGAESWKSFYYGRQRPNPDMIEAVCRAWPEYAFWIATGFTDSAAGDIGLAEAYETELNLEEKAQPIYAIQYKRTKAKILQDLLKEGRSHLTDDEIRTIYATRSRRELERMNDISRGKASGYFDPRMLKASKLDDGDGYDGDK